MSTKVEKKAPVIKHGANKSKYDAKGYSKRSLTLETCIMRGLGDRDMAMLKIMLYLTGNAEGWGVSEKDICTRCNISEVGYKKARKKLCDMGWITLVGGKSITVNYDEIYKVLDTREENEAEAEKDKNKKGYTEDTHEKEIKKVGYTEDTHERYTEDTPKNKKGYTEDTYNNIPDNLNNMISGLGISAKAETPAVPREKEAGNGFGNHPKERIPTIEEWKF